MLLSRHAHSVGVDLRKSLHVRGGIVDRDDSQWWFRQTVDQPFARSAEKINRHLGKKTVPNIQPLRDAVESKSDQGSVSSS